MTETNPRQILVELGFSEMERTGGSFSCARLKEEFFTRTGTPSLEDPSFESRMNMFEDWVLLDVPLASGLSLLEDMIFRRRIVPSLMETAQALCVSQPGLFVLMAPWKKEAWFRDLHLGADFVLRDAIPVAGLEPGQILQGRLYADSQLRISPGQLVHSKESTEAVVHLVRLAGDMPALDLLHLLAKLVWRAGHYPRQAPRHFYDPANPLVRDIFHAVGRGFTEGKNDLFRDPG